jgi:hypothetical protein
MELEVEIYKQLEIRFAQRFAGSGSRAAVDYLRAHGVEEVPAPVGYESIIGTAWQFAMCTRFNLLSKEFEMIGRQAVSRYSGKHPALAQALSPKVSDVQCSRADAETDFRGFVSLDMDFASDVGVQMLSVFSGSSDDRSLIFRRNLPSTTIARTRPPFATFQLTGIVTPQTLRLIERFPAEVFRLIALADGVEQYVDSSRTKLSADMAKNRFQPLLLAAPAFRSATSDSHAISWAAYLRDESGDPEPFPS